MARNSNRGVNGFACGCQQRHRRRQDHLPLRLPREDKRRLARRDPSRRAAEVRNVPLHRGKRVMPSEVRTRRSPSGDRPL